MYTVSMDKVRGPVVIYMPAFPMNLSPVWVAFDKGFFREEGVEVELAAVLGGGDGEHPRFRWRREGKIVFISPAGSCPFRSVLEGRDRTDTEINVVSIARHTAHVLVARPDRRDPAALRGARLGADAKGGSGIDARIVLRQFGLDPERDVTWINSRGKPPDTERYRLDLFDRGELDAVCCDPPHWNVAVKMGGVRLTSARDLMVLPEAGVGTTPQVIDEHPGVVKGVVRAVLRGAEFARVNREETLDSILRHNTHVDRDMAGTIWDSVHDDWGPVLDLDAYRRKAEIYSREWHLPARPLSAYYNFAFLKQALEELRLLRAWDPQMDAA